MPNILTAARHISAGAIFLALLMGGHAGAETCVEVWNGLLVNNRAKSTMELYGITNQDIRQAITDNLAVPVSSGYDFEILLTKNSGFSTFRINGFIESQSDTIRITGVEKNPSQMTETIYFLKLADQKGIKDFKFPTSKPFMGQKQIFISKLIRTKLQYKHGISLQQIVDAFNKRPDNSSIRMLKKRPEQTETRYNLESTIGFKKMTIIGFALNNTEISVITAYTRGLQEEDAELEAN